MEGVDSGGRSLEPPLVLASPVAVYSRSNPCLGEMEMRGPGTHKEPRFSNNLSTQHAPSVTGSVENLGPGVGATCLEPWPIL